MRIKWTSIHRVLEANPVAPWIGPGLAERLKRDAAVEAAFCGIKKASDLIDMRRQKGAHPRMGATDVCPFIPVSNVSWEEAIACANQLGKRVGEELKIPVYLYEKAAKDTSRSNLAVIREGEYEGFFDKIKKTEWHPDFGWVNVHRKGATRAFPAKHPSLEFAQKLLQGGLSHQDLNKL